VARVDVEMEVAICVPCKEAKPALPWRQFCGKCGTQLITGKVLFELEDGVVQRILFTQVLQGLVGEEEAAE